MARAKYYTREKYKWRGREGYHRETLPDGRLFANGTYASKMTEEKLPKSFVSVYYYRQWSFMQAKGVVDVRYCPAYWSGNHMYKDDYLLISYKEKITCRMPEARRIPIDEYQGYDIILFGRSIIDFLDGVEKYSHLDVSAIRKEMRRKRIWYVRKNPSHQELSNDEIDFETKVYFLAREFESSDFSLELQKEEFLKYCHNKKLTPMNDEFVCGKNAFALDEVLKKIKECKESSPDDYFIVIFPLTEEDRDDYNRRNSIEIGLGRLGIVTETIYIWRREK